MDYTELKKLARRGDRAAAAVLLPRAQVRIDLEAVLVCWRLLNAHRHSAAHALLTTLRAAESRGQDGADGHTGTLRHDIVARALVDGTRQAGGDDPVAPRILDLAEAILNSPGQSGEGAAEFEAACKAALVQDDDDCVARLAQLQAAVASAR